MMLFVILFFTTDICVSITFVMQDDENALNRGFDDPDDWMQVD